MKRAATFLLAVGFTVFFATSAFAVVIGIDESGNMTINGNPGSPGTTAIPDPTTGAPALSYALPFAGNVGDIVLLDPADGSIDDVIRFPGNGRVYFYSDNAELSAPEPGVLADGPIPPPINPNFVTHETGVEGNNGLFGYSPGVAGPGGEPTGTTTYDFISEVPEPGSLALVGLGLLGVGIRCRRRWEVAH